MPTQETTIKLFHRILGFIRPHTISLILSFLRYGDAFPYGRLEVSDVPVHVCRIELKKELKQGVGCVHPIVPQQHDCPVFYRFLEGMACSYPPFPLLERRFCSAFWYSSCIFWYRKSNSGTSSPGKGPEYLWLTCKLFVRYHGFGR